MNDIPFGWVIAGVAYFGFNVGLLGLLVADALHTRRESGLTIRHILLALFVGLPVYAGAMLLVWGLPHAFPDKFRVGGEKIEVPRVRPRRPRFPKRILSLWRRLRAMGMSRWEAIVTLCVILVILVDVAVFGASVFDC